MPVVAFRDILDRAFNERYGVAAFNVVDDVSLRAVIDAATQLESPLPRPRMGDHLPDDGPELGPVRRLALRPESSRAGTPSRRHAPARTPEARLPRSPPALRG